MGRLTSPGTICDAHETEVCGGGCWVCATIHSHPDREKLINQLRKQLLQVEADNHTLVARIKKLERLARGG